MPRWQHLAYAGSIIATIAVLGACSSGSSKGSGSATSGPNPNATESNVAGDIPGLGWLFKNHRSQRQMTDLYFFVTPTILDTVPVAHPQVKPKVG